MSETSPTLDASFPPEGFAVISAAPKFWIANRDGETLRGHVFDVRAQSIGILQHNGEALYVLSDGHDEIARLASFLVEVGPDDETRHMTTVEVCLRWDQTSGHYDVASTLKPEPLVEVVERAMAVKSLIASAKHEPSIEEPSPIAP